MFGLYGELMNLEVGRRGGWVTKGGGRGRVTKEEPGTVTKRNGGKVAKGWITMAGEQTFGLDLLIDFVFFRSTSMILVSL